MAEDSGYYQDPFEGQTISPTTPSWKDRIAQFMMGDQRPSVERRNFVEGLMGTSGIGPSGFGIASLTPAGPILDAQEAAREGDYRGAALAAVPIPGASKIRGALSAAEDAALARIRAYHGSPADFDAFDPAKMSSGFGAQAKGRGFSFSESEDVARGYRRPVGGSGPSIGGRPVNLDDPAEYLANELRFNSPEDLRKTLQQEVDYLTRMKRDVSKSKEAQALEYLKSGKEVPKFDPPGKLYEVDIKSSQDNFIDWDKPFKEQSGQVQAKISERFPEFPKDKPVGEILYQSPALEELGVAGVKFRQDGVTNYTVFDPQMIDIVQKYNQGGLVTNPLDRYLGALGQIESGNNYTALGPRTESGNQAYGRYQVMDFNIPVWTKEVLGQSMTPQQFLENKQAQDAVARAKFGQYLEQTGNPYDAASMWFSGRPMQRAGQAADVTGTTVPEYVSRFAGALGEPMQQNAEGIASLNAEELALARERMNMDRGPSRRDRQRMMSAIMDYYESTKPQEADFSMLRPMGRRG